MNGGACIVAGNDVPDDDGAGVDVRLRMEPEPIMYDCEMFVRPKKEEAAASMVSSYVQVASVTSVRCRGYR